MLAQLQTDVSTWLNTIAIDGMGQPLPLEFGHQPRSMVTDPYVLVDLMAIAPVGLDWREYEYDELTDELVEKMKGNRRVTLMLRFLSFNQSSWGTTASQYAEQFRLAALSTTSIDTVHDFVNVGQWGVGPLARTDYEVNGRWISQVNVEVTLGVLADLTNTDYSGSYIKKVDIEGQSTIIDELSHPVEDESGEPIIAEEVMTIHVDADEAP